MTYRLILLSLTFFVISCSKNSSTSSTTTCSWSSSLLQNKTYYLSRVDSGGQNITTRWISRNPCESKDINFVTTTYTSWSGTPCTQYSRTFDTKVLNGVNYIILDGDNFKIDSFGCTNFSFKGFTYTKR